MVWGYAPQSRLKLTICNYKNIVAGVYSESVLKVGDSVKISVLTATDMLTGVTNTRAWQLYENSAARLPQ